MRIGISFVGTKSVFDGGVAQATFAIAQACREAGHDPVLIGTLWPDAPPGLYPSLSPALLPSLSPRLDLLIDMEGRTGLRSALMVVALLRSDPSRVALEQAAYLSQEAPVDLTGVHQVWVWDTLVSEERVPLVEQLLQKPVKRVPYVWTPIFLQQTSLPPVTKPYTVLLSEKNTTVADSCIVPLIECCRASSVQSILVSNGAKLLTNAYFQTNLAPSVDKPTEYRDRIVYQDLQESVVAVANEFRPGLLDLLWLQIPLLHSAPALKAFGSYYEDGGLCGALEGPVPPCPLRAAVEAFGRRPWAQVFEKPTRTILFTDMWEGFKATDNFFLDLLRNTDPTVHYVGSTVTGQLLLCGPFGTQWMESRYTSVPKVFFLGEPFEKRLMDPRLNLVLSHDPVEDETHMRLPLWPLFLDWFGSKNNKNNKNNPNQLPLRYALEPAENTNREFCAFVVSNPGCTTRNEAFDQLNAYRRVNSAGAYKNNLGEQLFCKFGGGGGGDQAKFEFLKQHRFSLCYENTQQPGYVTEKLLHAKLAGCVPLYWGSKEAAQDFDPTGFIDMDGKDIVEVVRSLEEHPERMQEIQRTPALTLERFAATRALLDRVGQRLVALSKMQQQQSQQQQQSKFTVVENAILEYNPLKPSALTPLFVSFATARFLPSLTMAIQSVAALRRSAPALRFRAYLGSDVSKEQEQDLRERFDWITVKRLGAAPAEFPDMFEPRYFGWKLAILKEVCADPDLEGDAIVYCDAGVSWIRMPDQMLQVLDQVDVCLVTDPTQINRPWCSPAMVEAMQVTDKELDAQQLQAATLGFIAGSTGATRLFEEAFAWGAKRECLFGDYAIHRHDQSILSVLSLRHEIHTIPLPRFLCATSLRKAHQRGVAGYHHHGTPKVHEQVVAGIDDIWVISLERRFDRWKSLLESHPGLEANRLPAIDGQQLVLTQELYNLFQRNDFRWKKSVMGCALSHILLWIQLASEHPSVQNYLILEDDCRFTGAWKQQLKEVMDAAPLDADLLLLGGVLPSNLAAYPSVLNPINRFWATVKPNGLFTGGTRDIEHFHFCAYSYVLTRQGATKLLAQLQQGGCYTSLDHYLCHPTQGLKKYVLRDLITTCSQASDPVYQAAAFDEMLRVDSYDSDIWNNAACFDISGFTAAAKQQSQHQSLWPIVAHLLSTQPHSIQTRNTVRESALAFKSPVCLPRSRSPSEETTTVYYLPEDGKKVDATLEEGWLQSLWPSVHYAPFTTMEDLPADAWVLVAKPRIEEWTQILAKAIRPFRVLHMSDEGCDDRIDFYDLPLCTRIVRNYVLPGLNEKVVTVPLGWAKPLGWARSPLSLSPLPTFSERSHIWGFHGADWKESDFGRKRLLAPLETLTPNECLFQDGFNQPSDYSAMLLKSKFAPAPRGNHAETFRLYEALEHGCVPIYVRSTGDEAFWNWLRLNVSLLEIRDWAGAVKVMQFFLANPDKAERYRTGLLDQWNKWKGELRQLFL